jgi:hypothetical protein
LLLGSVISDPGVENQIAVHTGGPEGDEIPNSSGANPVWLDGSVVASGANQSWVQSSSARLLGDIEVIVSTANPRSGTKHLRFQEVGGTKADVDNNFCIWAQGLQCETAFPTNWVGNRYAARCDPGHVVTWGGYFTASDIGAPAAPEIQMNITWNTITTGFNGQITYAADLTASYAYHEIVAAAPANTHYAKVQWFYSLNDSTTSYFDGDDFVLSVL